MAESFSFIVELHLNSQEKRSHPLLCFGSDGSEENSIDTGKQSEETEGRDAFASVYNASLICLSLASIFFYLLDLCCSTAAALDLDFVRINDRFDVPECKRVSTETSNVYLFSKECFKKEGAGIYLGFYAFFLTLSWTVFVFKIYILYWSLGNAHRRSKTIARLKLTGILMLAVMLVQDLPLSVIKLLFCVHHYPKEGPVSLLFVSAVVSLLTAIPKCINILLFGQRFQTIMKGALGRAVYLLQIPLFLWLGLSAASMVKAPRSDGLSPQL